jgi:hypothetical protein
MYTTIPFIRFDDIIEDARRIMATVGVYNFDEIIAVDPDVPPRRTLRTLLERANATFSRHFPLLYIQTIVINNNNIYTFIDNFDLYIAGTLDPAFILMIPDAVINVSSVPIIHAKWPVILFNYQPPYLIFKGKISGKYYAKTLCKYKLYFDNNNVSNDAVYYMERSTPLYDIFIKQFVYDLSYFIITMKRNYNITELPIEVFGGLEDFVGELKSELETLYSENPRNYLIMY